MANEQRHQAHAQQTFARFQDLLEGTGIDRERAAEISASVLCTLEQRIFGEEAQDLEAQLPVKVRELLVRCPRHKGPPPKRFDADEFMRRVSEDLRCSREEAERYTRGVFSAVRALISEGEAMDVEGQLPRDLHPFWAREI